MLKNKSLLYGLGTGLILGAVLLQLMNAVAPASTAASKQPEAGQAPEEMDRIRLKEVASTYFNVYDKNQKLYDQPQVDAMIAQKLQEERDKQAAQPQSAAPDKETYIYVSKGMGAAQVADLLQQSGVIADRTAFVDTMKQKQLNDKIVSGLHVFKGAQELTQVIANLTTQ
ncbi:hypothetical protein [Paenibacillus ehimensis]|uniref:Uncharacterized protein n=1 Tax=Paenibacillus ehimensis TaxID=79264 RepID=A0ABT8V4E6_9BACL|nr:hypothetical protein [Paenibacillus ehimensis]MDO3676306.1 hypothetical protein [Paenibacillus ehimensis]MEC0212312.1 hypothetical protein [Paenibacillus ehimensis]